MVGKRRIPPTSVNSGSIRTRFMRRTDFSISERMAPCMMSAGDAPLVTWLITSDSAKTAHTPEIDTGSSEVSTRGPISSSS